LVSRLRASDPQQWKSFICTEGRVMNLEIDVQLDFQIHTAPNLISEIKAPDNFD
jgi:hypothetical protein